MYGLVRSNESELVCCKNGIPQKRKSEVRVQGRETLRDRERELYKPSLTSRWSKHRDITGGNSTDWTEALLYFINKSVLFVAYKIKSLYNLFQYDTEYPNRVATFLDK